MRDIPSLIDEMAARLARAEARRAAAHPRFVGEVVDLGDMPSAPEKYYMLQPVSVTGSEGEGDPAVFTPHNDPVPVVVMGSDPSAGERLVAHFCDHRWVASKPTSPRGFCPLCSMETRAYLKLTFTFSTGQIAYKAAVARGDLGSGESREYIWQFIPNPLDGSTSNFSFYPDFYQAHGYISCNKDRTRIWFGGERDVLPVLGRANFIEPVPELDESHVVSCSPLHIVWSGSVPLRYPVAAVGNLIGFEAEEVP